jgi:O-antigen ligase
MHRFLELIFAIPREQKQGPVFALFAVLSLSCLFMGTLYGMTWVMAIPAVILLFALLILDYRSVFFLLMASIPLSVEQVLPGGLGTDFPSEQLMWLLTLSGIFWFLRHGKSIDARFLKHPISIALFAHLAWMTVCVVTSQDPIISFKHWLAKGWYVIVFYFIAAQILHSEKAVKTMVWAFFIPLVSVVLIILVRHAGFGFSYEEKDYVTGPFFRNHVASACSMAIFIPFVWFGAGWYPRYSRSWYLFVGGVVVFLIGINFAYTRAAYVALIAAVGIYWAVRWRMMKTALVVLVVMAGLFISFLNEKDNWLMFAPDYERTVTSTRFESLLEATTKLEDISTMERVYRWVAATYMIRDRPYTGFGPGTFYFHYKNYTVNSFKTYVSDNPERSGIHNYFLMMCVEQGFPGLIFFIILLATSFLMGEKIYHQTRLPARKAMVMAALLCFVLINLLMLMNDLVETDKIGSLFFMSLALLVNADLANKKEIE